MINLLPPLQQKELQAARSNTLLVRYNIILAGILGLILLAIGGVTLYLNTTKASSEQIVQDNNAKVADFDSVKNQADSFRENLRIGKEILNSEINYSNYVLALAALMPPGTVLQTLNLDQATFGTETTLAARAKSYQNALELKNALEKSSMFTNVHFQSITDSTDPAYPVGVTLAVTFKKEVPNAAP